MVRMLISFGARTDLQNALGRTPLDVARDTGHDKVLKIVETAHLRELRRSEEKKRGLLDEKLVKQNEKKKLFRLQTVRLQMKTGSEFSPLNKDCIRTKTRPIANDSNFD